MYTLLIGTYTRNTSQGIYQTKLNTKDSSLEKPILIGRSENPTYLDYDAERDMVFSISQKGTSGGIAIWSYKNDKLELIRQELSPGSAPCYIFYDKVTDRIYDANYHLGNVNIYDHDGLLKYFQYPQGAHAHFAATNPVNQNLYTVDLAHDIVRKYENLTEIAEYHSAKGAGPRHIAFHPTAPYFYLLNELNCTVELVHDDGYKLNHVQTISMLPENSEMGSGAAIRITKDGKFLYTSTRGIDIITVFKISEDYQLTPIQYISTQGKHPRDFALSPDEKHLVVANRDSNNLTVFTRDTVTGLLVFTEQIQDTPEPVSVLFIEEEPQGF